MIRETIEINRRPEDVFAYLDELERHGEWQTGIVSSRIETGTPVGVGTRVAETRNVNGRERRVDYEITEHEPPRRTVFRGVNGPIRPVGTVTVEPVSDGSQARVTIELDLVGHGLGKLIAPLARSQARKQVPVDQKRLKERLEAGA